MSDAELAKRPELTTAQVLPNHVARYYDMMALADRKPVNVIGPRQRLSTATNTPPS